MSGTRTAAALSALLLATVGLTGCGDDSSTASADDQTTSATKAPSTTSSSTSPSTTPPVTPTEGSTTPIATENTADPDTKVIAITVKGDTIDPSGDEVEVEVGQPIDLKVTADAPGEIHVHSSPEQEFEYDTGTTTLRLAAIEIPSQVVVESHTLEKVIVTLQVQP